MPRFLWLGLVVCVIGLIAALVFVRSVEPALDADPAIGAAHPSLDDAPLELVAGQDVEQDRAPIENAAAIESDMWAKVRRGEYEASQSAHSSFTRFTKVEPKFDAGVIEVRVVRNHDGLPMAGVNVALERTWDPDVQVTDSGGIVIFTNVDEGTASVSAILAGHARTSGQASIDRQAAHKNVELRLVVERQIVVRLRDPNGRTFDSAAWQLDRRAANRIGIRLDSRCGRLGSAFEAVDVIQFGSRSAEDELGPFTWRVRIQGLSDVCVHALLDDVIVGLEQLDPLATELDVRLDPAAIEAALTPAWVRVLVQGSDAPIPGALIEFERSFSANSKPPSSVTQVDGRASVSMAAAPSTQVVVSARGYARVALTLARPFPDEFIVRMAPARRIAGRVVDQEGNPLSNVRVELRMVTGNAVRAPSTRSRKDGHFEFENVVAAEYRVLTAVGNDRVEAKADCRERDATDVRLTITFSKAESSPASR